MFTGIITGIGRIVATTPLGNSDAHGLRLTIDCPPHYLDGMSCGDSMALNGACMTVTQMHLEQQQFSVDISAESLSKTTGLNQRGYINLEKALRAQDCLGGHIVSGHVDGIGSVTHFAQVGESWQLRVMASTSLAKYLAFKGSVTINGVSLTVNQVQDRPEGCEVSINLIPHTLDHTTLGSLQIDSTVNLEIDLIARYCERMLNYCACNAPTP